MEKKNTKPKKAKTITPSLSADKVNMDDIHEKVQIAINNRELKESIDRWLKENASEKDIKVRDLQNLSGIVTEYLDSYILFGYSLDGERVIIQNYRKPKDRDAMMEFLKIVFLKYNNELND